MWWRSRRRTHEASTRPQTARSPGPSPVVLALTEPLTAATAEMLGGQVGRLSADTPVVIDVTAIPSFDSEGTASLAGLQDRHGAERVTIVGLRQAAARLTGADAASAETTSGTGWTLRLLHNLAVVQAEPGGSASADGLEAPLTDALEQDVAIVVCDLRGVELTDPGAAALAFASGSAAVRGQELLVVNVSAHDVGRLRLLGLSATTFVAPES